MMKEQPIEKQNETRELTEQQKAEYIEHKGMRCPVCKSHEVQQDLSPDITEDGIFINCMCDSCEEEWVDKYVLTEVNLAEECLSWQTESLLDKSLDDEGGEFPLDDEFGLDDEFEAEEEIGYEEPVIGHADDDWKDDTTDLVDK